MSVIPLRNSPISTITMVAARIADEHPPAAGLARRILLEASEVRPWPEPRPISAALTDDEERPYLLFCPAQGGWQTGVHFEGRWRDFATLSVDLEPTLFMDVPPEPEDV